MHQNWSRMRMKMITVCRHNGAISHYVKYINTRGWVCQMCRQKAFTKMHCSTFITKGWVSVKLSEKHVSVTYLLHGPYNINKGLRNCLWENKTFICHTAADLPWLECTLLICTAPPCLQHHACLTTSLSNMYHDVVLYAPADDHFICLSQVFLLRWSFLCTSSDGAV